VQSEELSNQGRVKIRNSVMPVGPAKLIAYRNCLRHLITTKIFNLVIGPPA